MLAKMGQAKKNATRMAAILLSVMAIILGIATPLWSDTTGSLSLPSTTFYGLDFSADIGVTTLNASLGIGTTNNTTLTYTIPTPTAAINLGIINPYTLGSSITLNPQVQFATSPTFSVTDKINFNNGLNLSGFGQSITYSLPNDSSGPISWKVSGDQTLTTSASGTPGSGSQTLSQTGNSGTLWSVSGNGLSLLEQFALVIPGGQPVAAAAHVLQDFGFYFNPTLGISVNGNYTLGVQPTLNPINVSLVDSAGYHPLSAGDHGLTINDPLTLSLSATAKYQYEGDFYIKYGDKLSLGPFDWDVIGPNKLGSEHTNPWDPSGSPGNASAQVNLADFAVGVTYTIPDSWTNPHGTTMILQGAHDYPIPLTNAGSIWITGTLNNNNPGTLNNFSTLDNAGGLDNAHAGLTIESGGTLNNNAGGTLNNDFGGFLTNGGTLNNNTGGTLTNSGWLFNNSGGVLTNSAGATLNNKAFGTLINSGGLNNYGTLNNSGTLTNDGGGLSNHAGGTLTNSGTLTNTNLSAISNLSGGTLTNSGRIDNISSWLYNFGTFNNSGNLSNSGSMWSGGTQYVGTLWNISGGTLTNSGLINNWSGCEMANNGILINSDYLINNASGTLYNNVNGILTNYGFLNNMGTLHNIDNATLNNNLYLFNNGVMNNSATLNNNASGTLNNNYHSTLNNNAGGTLNNYGRINNQAGSTLNNNAGGTLNNYGRLTNTDLSIIKNYGTLNNDSGRYLFNDVNCTLNIYSGGTLNNSGLLSNPGWLYVESGGTVNNNAGGTLSNWSGGTLNTFGTLNNSGTLTNSGEIIGNGTYTQTAGYTINAGKMEQGPVTIDGGGYYLSSTGSLTVRGPLTIGNSGTGTFIQEGGSNHVQSTTTYGTGILTLGVSSGGSGTYTLQGGSLSTSSLYIGDSGTGAFTQTGGGNYAQSITLGYNSGGIGTYELSGPEFTGPGTSSFIGASYETIGRSGTGNFIQTGGYNQASNWIGLGSQSNSSGTYTLQDGTVRTKDLSVGVYGTGSFIQTGNSSQTGGSVTLTNSLIIGALTGSGTYTMDKGTLTTKDLTVGSTGSGSVTGTLAITNAAAQVNVGRNFTINERGLVTVAPGVTVTMTGANFYDYKPNDDLSNLRLFFSNPAASDTLGFAGQLTLGTLELTGGTEEEHLTLNLENLLTTSSSMTLYVGSLILGDYCTLDLNGLNLFFLNESLGTGVTFLDGMPQQGAVPLPASVWLFLSGLAGLGLLGRGRKGNNS